MSRFTRTTGIVTAMALTVSTFSITSASAFNPGMRQHGGGMQQGMRHHGGGGGYGRAMAVGAGIGLGVGIIGALIQAEQNRQIENQIRGSVVRMPPAPKKPQVVRKNEGSTVRTVKKDDVKKDLKPTLVLTTVRVAHPVYVAPTLPADPVEVKNCGADCDKLWQSIQRYKAMINEDTRKLADRKAELINRNAELNNFRERSRTSAADWDKEYNVKMANITENSISDIEESIERIQKLIDQEQEILKDRIAQYEDCVKRNCPPGANAALAPR